MFFTKIIVKIQQIYGKKMKILNKSYFLLLFFTINGCKNVSAKCLSHIADITLQEGSLFCTNLLFVFVFLFFFLVSFGQKETSCAIIHVSTSRYTPKMAAIRSLHIENGKS